jgi:hypothetical protein
LALGQKRRRARVPGISIWGLKGRVKVEVGGGHALGVAMCGIGAHIPRDLFMKATKKSRYLFGRETKWAGLRKKRNGQERKFWNNSKQI